MIDRFQEAKRKLEFEKIQQHISRFLSSDPGRQDLEGLAVCTSKGQVESELARVSEIKAIIEEEGDVPLSGIHDVRKEVRRSSVSGVVLSPWILLQVGSTLRAARVMRSFLAKHKNRIPLIWEKADLIHSNKVLEYNIDQAVDPSGSIRSEASKELRLIRRSIVEKYERLRKRLDDILSKVSDHGFSQEDIITTREGRMVIPVKREHKNRVPGFIHSSSSSGATVFVEPTPTLELNNEITDLQFREKREIERILADLSAQVREVHKEILADVEILAMIDSLHARAKYSVEILGCAPTMTDGGEMALKNARHPLLISSHGYDATVPMDVSIGKGFTTLVISGPNAGGKSVMLKSVGLLSLMAQSGIHIPVDSDSALRVFNAVFADIGDEQSIENDLSTFSSHLSNLRDIVTSSDEHTLVLLDEIGTGTDPAEGSVFAAALLEKLTRQNAVTIATTHHGYLKVFAHQTDGIENGAMEFDQSTLTPTYRFRCGVPGSSYALEMAKRMEMDSEIITRSRELLGVAETNLESLLSELEDSVQKSRAGLKNVETEKARLDALVRDYESRLKGLSKEMHEQKRLVVGEARALVDGANALIEKSIREIRESGAANKAISAVREDVRRFKETLEKDEPVDSHAAADHTGVNVGNMVVLRSGSEPGLVESIDRERKFAYVLSGNIRMRVRLRDLVPTEKRPPSPRHPVATKPDSEPASHSVDVRGMTGSEAVVEVDRLIDRAILSGLFRIDIIHGKGTGALRKKVGDHLKSDPRVESFRLGEWNEGGAGVTVVTLAQ